MTNLNGDSGRFWLVLQEPGLVPERKGSWAMSELRTIIREFMKARPTAYIHVLTVNELGEPSVQHGPEALQMADGRSMGAGRKHNERTRTAHADHHAPLLNGDSSELVCACGKSEKRKRDHRSIRELKRATKAVPEALAYIEELEALWDYAKRQGNVWRGIAAAMGYEPKAHLGVRPTNRWMLDRIKKYRAALTASNNAELSERVGKLRAGLEKQGLALAAFVNLFQQHNITGEESDPVFIDTYEWSRDPTKAEIQAALEAQNEARALLTDGDGR